MIAPLSLTARVGNSAPRTPIEPSVAKRPAPPLALPGLRAIGRIGGTPPKLVTDTREQQPLPFSRLVTERGTLQTGDYSFRGGEELFAIERKSIADLVGCCVGDNRDRFFRELHRLRGYRFKRLLIVGTREQINAGAYHSRIAPQCVNSTLAAIEMRYDVPVVFSPTPEEAGVEVEKWAFWFARELLENVNGIARGLGLTSAAGGSANP